MPSEPNNKDLDELLRIARDSKPTEEEAEEQRQSFAFGNTHFENERITRETVRKAAEDLKKQRGPQD